MLLILIFCGAIFGAVALVYQEMKFLIASAVLAIVSALSAAAIEFINSLGRNYVRQVGENVAPVVNPPG